MNTRKKKLHQIIYEFSLSRTTRIWMAIKPSVEELRQKGPKSIQEELEEHVSKFEVVRARVRVLKACNAFLYLLLYVSVVSTFLGGIAIINQVVTVAQFISGIAGTTAVVVLIAIFSKLVNLYVSDAHIIADFIVAMKVKYCPKNNKNTEQFL